MRYVATFTAYVHAENDSEAIKKANKLKNLLLISKEENEAELEELHIKEFGNLNTKKINLK